MTRKMETIKSVEGIKATMSKNKEELTLKIDLKAYKNGEKLEESKSGKTYNVATTGGFKVLDQDKDLMLSLNINTNKKKYDERTAKKAGEVKVTNTREIELEKKLAEQEKKNAELEKKLDMILSKLGN